MAYRSLGSHILASIQFLPAIYKCLQCRPIVIIFQLAIHWNMNLLIVACNSTYTLLSVLIHMFLNLKRCLGFIVRWNSASNRKWLLKPPRSCSHIIKGHVSIHLLLISALSILLKTQSSLILPLVLVNDPP